MLKIITSKELGEEGKLFSYDLNEKPELNYLVDNGANYSSKSQKDKLK